MKPKEPKDKDIDELNELMNYENTKSNIETIQGIKYLMNNTDKIQKINLSENKISDISEFFPFQNLVYLDLSKNLLKRLEFMSPLVNLEILILNNNDLKKIGFNLSLLRKLQHLDLGFNLLEVNDGELIHKLKLNPELISLVLNGNIHYNFEKCKYICLEELENIEFLDTKKITSKKPEKEEEKERKKPLPKVHIDVKGKGGKNQKVERLKDYIKFKLEDINENKQIYDSLSKQSDKPRKNYQNFSSYYYINSCKLNF